MADQELTDLQVLTALATGDLFFVRDVSANIDKQISASNVFNFLSTRSIDDLGDVDTTTTAPNVGEHLEWDGSNWVPGTAVLTLAGLSDTAISSPALDEIIQWNGSAWANETLASAGIAASSITLTAGVALTGGGDLTANRTFDVDITTLVVDAAPDGTADYVMTYDASGTAHKRVLLNNLPGGTGGGAPQDPTCVVQGRRTTTVSPGGSWTAVSFDVTDVENNSSVLDHSGTRITIKEDGPILVYYASVVNGTATSQTEARVLLNGTTVIPGSYQKFAALTASSAGDLDNVFTFVAQANDYIELEVRDAAGSPATLAADAFFGAAKLKGVKGLDWQGPWQTATPYQVDDAVEHNGVAYICIQDHTSGASNEPGVGGSWTTYWQILAKAGPDLGDLDDVTITAVALDDILQWNGSAWVNESLATAGIASTSHAATHVSGGTDEIDGDILDIDWNPTNYTPSTAPAEVTSADELTAHLAGIDAELATFLTDITGENFTDLADTPANYTGAGSRFVKVNAGATGLEFVADPGYLLNINAESIDELADVDTTTTAPSSGDILQWNGSNWVPVASDTPQLHAASHISGAGDEIDGDKLDIDWNPTNYTPTTSPTEVTSVDELTAHLAGIDAEFGSLTFTFLALTDTPANYTGSGGYFVKVNGGATALEFVANPGYLTDITSEDLGDLSDVTITTPASGEYLCFNGSLWVNATIAIDDLSDVDTTTTAPSSGDILQWNGSNWVPVASDTPQLHASTHHSGGSDPVDHDLLTNFVANEHIDHSAVTLTAGVALTGGGDITANRTFDVDISTLTVDAAPDGTADYVMTYDASGPSHKRVLLNNLPGGGGGGAPTAPQTVVQARRTSTVSPGSSWTKVSFDTTDVENNSSVLDHGLGSRLTIKEDGPILVYYASVVNGTASSITEARVLLNNSTVISGSYQKFAALAGGSAGDLDNVFTFVAQANDYIELQVRDAGGSPATLEAQSFFGAVKLTGVKGLDWQGPWQTATGYQTDDAVEHNGVAYICILDHTSGASNEPGVGASWTTYWQILAKAGPDLGDLDDVTITSIAAGEILKWNGSAWINNTLSEAGIASDTHTHTFLDLTDTPANYTGAGSRFVKVNSGATALEFVADPGYLLDITNEPLSDLSDVTITTIAAGEILKWNGSAWINNTLAEAGIASDTHTHTFLDLTDTPGSYSGSANYFVKVNSGTTALEFVADPGYLLNINSESLDDLSDVNITSVAAGEILVWNGSAWINNTLSEAGIASDTHTHTFLNLTDTPANYTGSGNYFVKVNSGATALEFVADPGYLTDITGENLNDLADVVITTPASGEYLCYNGSQWVNDAIDLGDLNDVTITAIASGEILVWNGSQWVNNTLAEAGIASDTHTHTFLDLTDTPANYTGAGSRFVKVNSGATALEFVADPGYLLNINSESIDDLSDVDTTTTAPSTTDVLTWDGSNWVPSAPGTPGAHASTHISGQTDEIDGDKLDIDWNPTNYTPTISPTEVTSVDELTAHLAGIDSELATFLTDITGESLSDLSDVTITSIAADEILVWSGSAWINQTLAEAGIASDAHSATHESGGTDELDGDVLDIDWNPTNYTPTTSPTEVTSVDELTAHLAGIDTTLGTLSGGSSAHDLQTVTATTTVSTNSGTYIDMPGMTLTTKNLGENGVYTITFSAYANNEKAERTARYRIVVGGVAQDEYLHSSQKKKSDETTFSFTRQVTGVANGTVIKIQFMVDDTDGAVNVFNRSLVFTGVPTSHVVT